MPENEGEAKAAYDALFRSLRYPERRRILFDLLERDPREALLVPEDLAAGDRDIDRLNLALVHQHLPALEDAGFVRWERDRNRVVEGPRFLQVRGVIEALKDDRLLALEE